MSANLAAHWALDPEVDFLNHGSFGACPRGVLERQAALRAELEREPVRFFARACEPLLDASRAALGAFLGASSDDLVFVPNATTGVNTVLRSLRLHPGDEILVTDHAYNAVRNAVDAVAARSGCAVVVAEVPFPVGSPGEIEAAVLAAVSGRTTLAVLDHVTSPTALVFPIRALVAALAERGIDTLVDGAHAPGMVPLALDELGAAYYTGNCHKWLCAPKGAGFLHVRPDRQDRIEPLVVSHGRNSPRTDRSRFQLEFGWVGTVDATAWACVAESLRFLGELLPGGWTALMAANHALALEARRILCERLGAEPPCPEEMLGSIAAVALPPAATPPSPRRLLDPLQEALYERHRIEVPVFSWPDWPRRWVRVSAQIYNEPAQYRRLAEALAALA